MSPRTIVIMLCLVTLGTLGAITGFGLHGLRDLRGEFVHYHRDTVTSAALAEMEKSLYRARAAFQGFLATRDGRKLPEALAAMENAERLAAMFPETLPGEKAGTGLGPLAAEARETVRTLRGIEGVFLAVNRVHADIVGPYLSRAAGMVREGLAEDREDPVALEFGLALREELAAAGEDIRVYAVSRDENAAARVQQAFPRLARAVEKYAGRTPGKEKRHAGLRAAFASLEKSFAALRDAVHAAQWQAAKTEKLLHAQSNAVRERFAATDTRAQAFSLEFLSRMDYGFWVLLSAGGGGVFLGLILGIAALVILSRKAAAPVTTAVPQPGRQRPGPEKSGPEKPAPASPAGQPVAGKKPAAQKTGAGR